MIGIHIIEPTVEFITPNHHEWWDEDSIRLLEECGRVSHKSEGRITEDSALPFLKRVAIDKGHQNILEHATFTVCFISSRAMSHQLVRTRIASYTQSSQRYCDYSKDSKAPGKVLPVIMPPSIVGGSTCLWGQRIFFNTENILILENGCRLIDYLQPLIDEDKLTSVDVVSGSGWCANQINAYMAYLSARDCGVPPEDARYHLTNATKTEVYTTMNFAMWRHWLGHPVRGRCFNPHAQWEIKMLARQVYEKLVKDLPILFEDLPYKTIFTQKELAIISTLLTRYDIESDCEITGMKPAEQKQFFSKLANLEPLMDKLST